MAGCDGWITFKILELLGAIFCMIYKRVSDDEANKLFYFLQKYSREWPLLNNITWEENGSIFTDITYGGYIIILIGLIIGHCSGELQRCRKMENFFLLTGSLLFIAAGSLELAALESVEERLVDNAAILGVVSLITAFLFIIDFLMAGKRRKREKLKISQKISNSKLTQTEGKCPCDCQTQITGTTYMNGNIQNGVASNHNGPRIPKNAVKLLPSSPELSEYLLTSEKHTNNTYLGPGEYYTQPLVFDGGDLKTHEGKIRSTESFLRSEKGLYPKVHKRFETDGSNGHFFVPEGYVLVPADQFQARSPTLKSDSGIGESNTPPGYSQIIPGSKLKSKKGQINYVISADDDYPKKNLAGTPHFADDFENHKRPRELFYASDRGTDSQLSHRHHRSGSYERNSSETSDFEEPKTNDQRHHDYGETQMKKSKKPEEYPLKNSRGNRKDFIQSEESSDEPKPDYNNGDDYSRPASRFSQRSKDWNYKKVVKTDEEYSNGKDDFSRRMTPHPSSTTFFSHDQPKSIVRFDYSPKKENGLRFPKDVQYNSLDGKKIADDLRTLKEITSSNLDLSRKHELEKRGFGEGRKANYRNTVHSDDEKDRRMSEREEQYFGLKDLKQSHREKKFEMFSAPTTKEVVGRSQIPKMSVRKDDGKKDQEEQEYRVLIDEKFDFLYEEDKKKLGKSDSLQSGLLSKDRYKRYDKGPPKKKSDSDDTNYSPSTDDEIRLRIETPGGASYKSEAMVWVENHRGTQASTPVSPTSPGYVLYTAQNWPESPSPQDRFQFNAKEAQQLAIDMPSKTPLQERLKTDFSNVEEAIKSSQKSRLLDFEEPTDKKFYHSKGFSIRKADDFDKSVTEVRKPTVIAGSTSTWKKWLQPKPKLVPTKSAPN